MEKNHTRFINGATPSKLERPDPNGRILVTYKQGDEEHSEEFDTVFFAIGRYALTSGLNLQNAGLVCEKNGKFKVNDEE